MMPGRPPPPPNGRFSDRINNHAERPAIQGMLQVSEGSPVKESVYGGT